MSAMIRLVVIDDSPFICRLIAGYLEASAEMQVLATLHTGHGAAERIHELRPDVITLDLEMPEMNGLEALQQIMEQCPTPVVVISGVSGRAATMTLQALERGAVDFVLKYTPGVDTDPRALRDEILTKVRLASQIRVVRSLPSAKAAAPSSPAMLAPRPEPPPTLPATPISSLTRVLVIGASTGGPLALRDLLAQLPASFPAAILIVQHIPASFTGVLAAQLQRHTSLQVREADDGDPLVPGTVLVAPGGSHCLLGTDSRVKLHAGPAVGGHCPSIDITMQSVAQTCGSRSIGVVLTGMGHDGTLGLRSIQGRGGATYAQDEATSVIFGMPGRALEQGVVDHTGSPGEIAQMLIQAGHLQSRGAGH